MNGPLVKNGFVVQIQCINFWQAILHTQESTKRSILILAIHNNKMYAYTKLQISIILTLYVISTNKTKKNVMKINIFCLLLVYIAVSNILWKKT